MKAISRVNTHLFLFERGSVLLSLREAPNVVGGIWSVISGIAVNHKIGQQLILLNAREELGIEIDPIFLSVVHTLREKAYPDSSSLFMSCVKWEGTPKNKKPLKCMEVRFFDVNALPENIDGRVKHALNQVAQGSFYSEYTS